MMSDAEPAAPEAAEPTAPETAEEEGAENEPTAQLPKSVLGGKTFKPGEEVVLEIVRVDEDSVVVKYASEKGGEEGGGGGGYGGGGGGGGYGMME